MCLVRQCDPGLGLGWLLQQIKLELITMFIHKLINLLIIFDYFDCLFYATLFTYGKNHDWMHFLFYESKIRLLCIFQIISFLFQGNYKHLAYPGACVGNFTSGTKMSPKGQHFVLLHFLTWQTSSHLFFGYFCHFCTGLFFFFEAKSNCILQMLQHKSHMI